MSILKLATVPRRCVRRLDAQLLDPGRLATGSSSEVLIANLALDRGVMHRVRTNGD